MSQQIQITCPRCGQQTRLKKHAHPRRVKCPSCSELIHVKASAEPTSNPSRAGQEFDFSNIPLQPLAPPSYLANEVLTGRKRTQRGPFGTKAAVFAGAAAVTVLLLGAVVYIIASVRGGNDHEASLGTVAETPVPTPSTQWQSVIVGQCRVKFPPTNDPLRQSTEKNNVQSTMLVDFRLETDSQYSLIVMSSSVAEALGTPEAVLESLNVTLTDLRSIRRNGAEGMAAKVVGGNRMYPHDTEIEIVQKGNVLVMAHYQPYSATRVVGRDPAAPRPNERDLDRPEEFFESVTIL